VQAVAIWRDTPKRLALRRPLFPISLWATLPPNLAADGGNVRAILGEQSVWAEAWANDLHVERNLRFVT
jgi:hypothetical protein